MLDFKALTAIAIIYALGIVSPGPNFMIVARTSISKGRVAGFATACGVVSVSMIWASASLFGLTTIFKLFPILFTLTKLLGGLYLCYLGYGMWQEALKPVEIKETESETISLWEYYKNGLASNLSNAKAIVFYASVFSAVAPSANETLTLWASLLVVLVLAISYYGFISFLFSTNAASNIYNKAKPIIERVCGLILIGFGVKLAFFY